MEKRKDKKEFKAKGLLSLSPSLSSLPSSPHPLGFCSSGLGAQTCFFLPPQMAPAKRKKRDACGPGQEEVPRPGRETPIFPKPQRLGELAGGFGEGQLRCPSPPKPLSNACPSPPTSMSKVQALAFQTPGVFTCGEGISSRKLPAPPPTHSPYPRPPVIWLTCRLWAGPGHLIFHSCTSSQDYSSQVGILGRFEMGDGTESSLTVATGC